MVMTVRSLRPVAPDLISAPVSPSRVSGTVLGQSLRGRASEFFVTPDTNGNRIEVPASDANAPLQRAREFCQSRGWRSSAHHRVEKVEQMSYLTDVLCGDVGG
jgi:hypothetical protein